MSKRSPKESRLSFCQNTNYPTLPTISQGQFEKLDAPAYKPEHGLLKLVEALEEKRDRGDWVDRLVVKESNAIYGSI